MNARLLTTIAVLLTACSPETTHTLSTQVTVGGGDGSTFVTNGMKIEVADSLHYELRSVTTSGASSRYESLAGHPFGMREGVFYIGDVEYGAVPNGATVKVSAEGVFVGDEKRGMVPEATVEQ